MEPPSRLATPVTMEHLIEHIPQSVTFSITLKKQSITPLNLHNISSETLAYKVKTTNLRRYCVRPNAALLPPGGKIDVELVQQAFRQIPNDIDACRDRFLLQVVPLGSVPLGTGGPIHGYETAMKLWEAVPSGTMVKARFPVCLVMSNLTSQTSSATQLPSHTTPLPELSPSLPSPPDSPTVSYPTHSSLPQPPAQPVVTVTTSITVPCAPGQPTTPSTFIYQSPARPASPTPPTTSVQLPFATVPQTSTRSLEQTLPPTKPATAPNESPNAPQTPTAATKQVSTPSSTPKVTATTNASSEEEEINYQSPSYVRDRALNIRTASVVTIPPLEESIRQRVALQRGGELQRAIAERQKQIAEINKELLEARHKLSDARVATRPAYDVRYEINENGRVSYAQIAIMTVISSAVIMLLF